MTKFVVSAWVLLIAVVVGAQFVDVWRISADDEDAVAIVCEGAECRQDDYSAMVVYLTGSASRLMIDESPTVDASCAEDANHALARIVPRGAYARRVAAGSSFDRDTNKTSVETAVKVFLPCDERPGSAYGLTVAAPVWAKRIWAEVEQTLAVASVRFDVTR